MDLLKVEARVLPALEKRFEARLGTSLVELDLLGALMHAPVGRLRMSEISTELTISTTSVTRLVDGLEERGLVERVLWPDDRRVVYASLTNEGRQLLRRARPVSGPALEDCFGRHYDTQELEAMRALLARALDRTST